MPIRPVLPSFGLQHSSAPQEWNRIGAINADQTPLTISGALTVDGAQIFNNVVTFNSTETHNGTVTLTDDSPLGMGFGSPSLLVWSTSDNNANELLIQLPTGGAVDVPVIVIGQGITGNLGLFDGVTEPRVAMFGVGAVATGPIFEFRKARGTVASPTVVTSGDDIGAIDFYGAVAAGEYVRGVRILAETTGTIATTRGPGVLTFQTATDAAPSVLTTAMVISAAQAVTLPKGPLNIGATGTATGAINILGTTSGTVTVTAAAAAGTWTMTLPTAVGAAGQQLTDAAGNGVTSWAAASLGEWKNDLGILDPHEALSAVVSAPTHHFTYNAEVMPDGQWAPTDHMTGIFAEEAPWAMHGEREGYRNGVAFSPVNAFGYIRAAVEAIYHDLQDMRGRLDRLEQPVV